MCVSLCALLYPVNTYWHIYMFVIYYFVAYFYFRLCCIDVALPPLLCRSQDGSKPKRAKVVTKPAKHQGGNATRTNKASWRPMQLSQPLLKRLVTLARASMCRGTTQGRRSVAVEAMTARLSNRVQSLSAINSNGITSRRYVTASEVCLFASVLIVNHFLISQHISCICICRCIYVCVLAYSDEPLNQSYT